MCPPRPGVVNTIRLNSTRLRSCEKSLGSNWQRRVDEQMSGRINWLEEVFPAPVQSILLGDIRQSCAEPHLQQWQALRKRWFSKGVGGGIWIVTPNFTNKQLEGESFAFHCEELFILIVCLPQSDTTCLVISGFPKNDEILRAFDFY